MTDSQFAKWSETAPIAKLDDIPLDLAVNAHRWLSHTPERRGHQVREDYVRDVNGLHAEMSELCNSDEQRAILAREMERYRTGYLDRYRTILHTRSRTASPMITGPANFPVERNRKLMEVEHKRVVEFLDWQKRARAAIKRAIEDARTPEEKTDTRWDQIRREIDWKFGISEDTPPESASYGSYAPPLVAGMIERLALNGETDLVTRCLELLAGYNSRRKRPFFTPRHRVWTFGELAEKCAAKNAADWSAEPTVDGERDGCKILINRALDRVQILFPGKPPEDVRAKLRSAAWNWSPQEGAWQRKLTNAAIYSARSILGIAS